MRRRAQNKVPKLTDPLRATEGRRLRMKDKGDLGRACEDLVAQHITRKTGFAVTNLNDEKNNHPATDLRITGPNDELTYEVSVKAKKTPVWPAVKGISNKRHYMVFVDVRTDEAPQFYVLSNNDWQNVLKKILGKRDPGAEIIKGALEWNWKSEGKQKKYRGSMLRPTDIKKFKNKWSTLPGIRRKNA